MDIPPVVDAPPVIDPATAATKASPPKQTLTWWGFTAIVMALGLAMLTPTRAADDLGVAVFAGRAVGALLIAGVLGLIGLGIGHFAGNRRLGFNIGVCLALPLLFLGLIGGVLLARSERLKKNKEALDTLVAVNDGNRQASLNEINRDGTISDSSRVDRAVDAMKTATEASSGKDRLVLEAGTEIAAELGALTKTYMTKVNAYSEDKTFEIHLATSHADLLKRQGRIDELSALNDKLLDLSRSLESRFASKLRAKGLPESDVTQAARGFAKGGRINLLVQVRQLDTDVYRKVTEMIAMLDKHFGSWEYENQSGINFKDPANTTKYLELSDELTAMVDRQTSLARQMLAPKSK